MKKLSNPRAFLIGTTLLAAATACHAGLVITPNFGSSITGDPNAAAIEAAVNSAIGTFEGLYSNSVSLAVQFNYTPAAAGNLLSTYQYYQPVSYASYVSALTADSLAHPGNAVLSTALANLSKGNDANGATSLALADGLYTMLGFGVTGNPMPVININSNALFSFGRPTAAGSYDLIGGLEHELDEVLGGGGAGSTLGQTNSFFTTRFGALDLYRYSAANTPSHSTSAASSYFSVDGGATSIIGFNQSAGGDYADFGPACGQNTAGGQYIQNAFNCTGQDEAYTASTPEAMMLQSIGWNLATTGGTSVPEPGSLALTGLALFGLAAAARRRGR